MNSILRRPRFGISLIFVLGAVVLCGSCSGDDEESYEDGGLFDARFQQVTVAPPTIVKGNTNTITWDIQPLYTGNGHILISGHGGGQAIGTITAPVVGELGDVIIPMEYVGGVSARSTFTLLVTTDLTYVGISFQAIYDSVLIDGDMISTRLLNGRTNIATFEHIALEAPR